MTEEQLPDLSDLLSQIDFLDELLEVGDEQQQPTHAVDVNRSVAAFLVRPMATQRPQNLLPREQGAVVHETVLYQTEGAGHFAIGRIVSVKGDSMEVHEFEPRKGVGTTFLPLWLKGKKRERKAVKPVGFVAEVVEVKLADLVCAVELGKDGKLTEASDNYLQTLGSTL